jgi:hypothetical protein
VNGSVVDHRCTLSLDGDHRSYMIRVKYVGSVG